MGDRPNDTSIVPGRQCGSCTLCCKVLSIGELAKPQGKWCSFCKAGKGCLKYEARPDECRYFYCGYLSWPVAGDHWQPSKCKMVIVAELGGSRVAIHVDPDRPMAWKEPPYYADLKRWAQAAIKDEMQVVVCVSNRVTVILPDEDIFLGPVEDDERIINALVDDGRERKWTALKLKADDPRIAGMEPGKMYHSSKR
jgi:hypothetical protein